MNNITKKIIFSFIIFLLIISYMLSSFAFTISQFDIKDVSLKEADELIDMGNAIVGIITTAGIVLSVVMLIVLGLKYMLGSVEEKATYKKSMMPYLIGALLIFSAATIANIIYNFAIRL